MHTLNLQLLSPELRGACPALTAMFLLQRMRRRGLPENLSCGSSAEPAEVLPQASRKAFLLALSRCKTSFRCQPCPVGTYQPIKAKWDACFRQTWPGERSNISSVWGHQLFLTSLAHADQSTCNFDWISVQHPRAKLGDRVQRKDVDALQNFRERKRPGDQVIFSERKTDMQNIANKQPGDIMFTSH